MGIFLKRALLLALFSLANIGVFATNYYVSTAGNDNTGNGTQGNPWKTVHKAVSSISGQGHTINVAAGTYVFDNITGQLILPPGISLVGASSNSTIFKFSSSMWYRSSGYGSTEIDHALIRLPAGTNTVPQILSNFQIDGDGKQVWAGIFVKERKRVEIQNLAIKNTYFTGLWLWDVDSSSVHDSYFENCAWGSGGWQSGAIHLGNVKNTNLYNLTVNEDDISGLPSIYGYGMKALGPDPANNLLKNVKLYNSTFTCNPFGLWNNSKSPNFALEWHNVKLEDCEIYDNTMHNTISLVGSYSSPNTPQLKSVKVHHNKLLMPADTSGSYAIELSNDYAEIAYNHFNGGQFPIAEWVNNGIKSKGWLIHHNTFMNNRWQIVRAQIGFDDIEFYNNTCYTTDSVFSNYFLISATNGLNGNNIKIKNNIFIYQGPGNPPVLAAVEAGGTASNVTATHNILYNVGAGNELDINTNNTTGNPLITGSGTIPEPYFYLQTGSPAINTGTPVGFTVPDGLPDRGAFEYTGSTPPAGSNVVLNAEFDAGSSNWTLGDWTGPTGGAAGNTLSVVQGAGLSGTNAAYVDIASTHTDAWRLQLYQQLSNFTLQVGKTYEISFMAKAQSARTINAALHGNTTNTDYWSTSANLTNTAQNFGPYSYTCNNSGVTGEASFSLAFFLANNAINDVWIDNVSVKDITAGVPVTSVSVTPSTLTVAVGATSSLTKTINPSNATNQNVSWTTSNASVATVNSSGVVTGVATGSATITVTTADGNKTATSAITVVIPVTGVTVSPATATLTIGGTTTVQLTKTISPANATNQNVTWTTSNASVATVNSSGLVTAVATGTATITATTQDGSFTATSAINVIPNALITLKLNENSGTAPVNTGTASSTFTRSTPTPAWSTSVPTTVGGASALDYGTTSGNYYVESAGVINELKNLTAFTLTGWVNCKSSTTGSGGNRIVSWINNGGDGVDLVYKSDGSLQLGVDQWPDGSPAFSSANKVTTNAAAPAANWVFFAVTYQSSTSQVQFYFGNNATDATLDVTKTYNRGAVGSNTHNLAIGHFNAATRSGALDRMFKGLIDEVQVYDSALTLSNIVAIQRGTVSSVAIIDNAIQGSGTSQHNYTGSGWTHAATVPTFLNSTLSYSNVANNAVTLSFVGNKIEWYTEKKNTHGIAAVSIDNGTEVNVDLYAATEQQQLLVYSSPTLTQGIHSFKIRVTGTKNAASTGFYAIHDYVKIYSSAGGGGRKETSTYALSELNEEQLVAYPNPVKLGEVLHLQVPEGTSAVKMIDVMGRGQHSLEVINKKVEVSTGGLSRGLHIVQYRNTRGLKHVKIIIE